jgi:digeranylgeranylglycerophospholipid reductase
MLKNVYDVIVVGAGPAGCKTAELAARAGLKVLLLEEHEEIGKPVQCTGIVSHRIIPLSGLGRKIVVNTVYKARFYAKNSFLELTSPKPVYVIDRHKLDKLLAEKAAKVGVEIITNSRFICFEKDELLTVKTSSGVYKAKMLVGADGPNSTVARAAGIEQPKDYLVGYQETVNADFSDNIVELWFGRDIAPDFFAWVVPENKEYARVGLAAKRSAVEYFKAFMKKRFSLAYKKKDVLAGIIRYGIIKTSVADNVLLVGDAASQVKPYSGGGIIYSLIAARYAAQACISAVESNKFDKNFLEEVYDKRWRKHLLPGIKRGLFLNRLIHAMPDSFFAISLNLLKPFTPLLNKLDMDLLFTQ